MGILDGGGLSYMAREARESLVVDQTIPELEGQFPVHLIGGVNHLQVASSKYF